MVLKSIISEVKCVNEAKNHLQDHLQIRNICIKK